MTPNFDSDIEIDENKLEISEKYDIMYNLMIDFFLIFYINQVLIKITII